MEPGREPCGRRQSLLVVVVRKEPRPASAHGLSQFPVDLVPQRHHHVERVAKRREHDRRDGQKRRRDRTGIVRLHDELCVGGSGSVASTVAAVAMDPRTYPV